MRFEQESACERLAKWMAVFDGKWARTFEIGYPEIAESRDTGGLCGDSELSFDLSVRVVSSGFRVFNAFTGDWRPVGSNEATFFVRGGCVLTGRFCSDSTEAEEIPLVHFHEPLEVPAFIAMHVGGAVEPRQFEAERDPVEDILVPLAEYPDDETDILQEMPFVSIDDLQKELADYFSGTLDPAMGALRGVKFRRENAPLRSLYVFQSLVHSEGVPAADFPFNIQFKEDVFPPYFLSPVCPRLNSYVRSRIGGSVSQYLHGESVELSENEILDAVRLPGLHDQIAQTFYLRSSLFEMEKLMNRIGFGCVPESLKDPTLRIHALRDLLNRTRRLADTRESWG